MAYNLLKKLIARKRYNKEVFLHKSDVYYAVNRMSDEEYKEIIALIEETFPDEEETTEE